LSLAQFCNCLKLNVFTELDYGVFFSSTKIIGWSFLIRSNIAFASS
jgi:hypothetical protein